MKTTDITKANNKRNEETQLCAGLVGFYQIEFRAHSTGTTLSPLISFIVCFCDVLDLKKRTFLKKYAFSCIVRLKSVPFSLLCPLIFFQNAGSQLFQIYFDGKRIMKRIMKTKFYEWYIFRVECEMSERLKSAYQCTVSGKVASIAVINLTRVHSKWYSLWLQPTVTTVLIFLISMQL